MEGIKKQKELSKEDVINRIGFIKQQAAIRENNDFKIPELNNLVQKIMQGKKDPQEALDEAMEILQSKQDYR